MKVMENVTEPDKTPDEREAEERWVEQQYRRHCPWRIRLAKWIRKPRGKGKRRT
jgi:hypothetical protein